MMGKMKTCYAIVLMVFFSAHVNGANFTVTNLNDSGPGSLRQAMLDANTTPETTDVIDVLVSGTVLLSTYDSQGISLLPRLDGTTINAFGLVLNRVPSNLGRFFQIDNGTVNDMVFDGGSSTLSGGALFLTNANLNGCLFINNVAGNGAIVPTGEGVGGAIRISGLSNVTNCTFTGNQAQVGAAIFVHNVGTLNLTNCTINANIVTPGSPEGAAVSNRNVINNFASNILSNTLPVGAADLYNSGTVNFKESHSKVINNWSDNLVENCTGDCPTFDFSADPQLLPLDFYGGMTKTFAIGPTSPIINLKIGAEPVPAAAIPTIGQWGLFILMLLLTSLGLVAIRQRRMLEV